MKCPTCDKWTVVKETRLRENNVKYRRYECANGHRFTTMEIATEQRSRQICKAINEGKAA